MLSTSIYLDHAATTPIRAEVLETIHVHLAETFGNPSSIHRAGRSASVTLQTARQTLAGLLNARPGEFIFTSGGTESDNAALRGIALARRATTGANRLITTAIEHKAILETAEALRDHFGFALTVLPVDPQGMVHVEEVAAALDNGHDVALVSVMAANNEIGTLQPVAEIGTLCRAHGIPFHTDAVQAGGRLALDVNALHVDALSLSAHKFYGPKGVGLLYLRAGTPFWPILAGGGQEGGRRGGTENTPLIAGMAQALALAEAGRTVEGARLRALRDQLITGLCGEIEDIHLTGAPVLRLDNHASFVVDGADAEGMLIALDLAGIAASSGSACASGSNRPSHVLAALGFTTAQAAGALRFSLGRGITAENITFVVEKMTEIVQRVRSV